MINIHENTSVIWGTDLQHEETLKSYQPHCLSAAGYLWAGVWGLVWMWLVWVVQFDMDDASDCQYIDYYSVHTVQHVPYLKAA